MNRLRNAPAPDDVEVVGGDAATPTSPPRSPKAPGSSYQTHNPPNPEWTAQFPALQAGVLAAAEATEARL